MDTNQSKHNSTQAQKTNFRFATMIAKLSCLVLCSMMTTMISIIFIVNASIHEKMAIAGVISLLATSFDITVNSLCLLLYWPYADQWYYCICKLCHKYMMNRCTNKVERYLHRPRKVTMSTSSTASKRVPQTQIDATSPNQSVESSIIINAPNE